MKIFGALLLIVLIAAGGWYIYQLKNIQSGVEQSTQNEIQVVSPQPNQKVVSPLKITGEARGGWYFEGTFSAEVLDSNNKSLGTTEVKAEGEWTTDNLVPFDGELTFTTPSTTKGSIVFKNANPSGLPQNEKKISIPISF